MRADKFFAEKFGSRTKAKEALSAGRILRGGRPLSPSDEVSDCDVFTVLEGEDFVSGGGRKLDRALDVFHESVEGETFADLGASTGGFTDCLLRRGASKVFCVDVGESLLDKTNARYLTRESFPERIGGVVSDLSFISLRLVLPAIHSILPEEGRAFVLFKPQFECGGKGLGKSGILPKAYHRNLLAQFYSFAAEMGLSPQNVINAPIFPKKNIEYVVFLKKGATPLSEREFLARAENFYENWVDKL